MGISAGAQGAFLTQRREEAKAQRGFYFVSASLRLCVKIRLGGGLCYLAQVWAGLQRFDGVERRSCAGCAQGRLGQVLELVNYFGAGYSLSVVAADGLDAGRGGGAVSQSNLDAGAWVSDRLTLRSVADLDADPVEQRADGRVGYGVRPEHGDIGSAGGKRGGDGVAQVELCRQHILRVVAQHTVQHPGHGYRNGVNGVRRQLGAAHRFQNPVQRRVVVAATGVQLEVVLLDTILVAESRHCRLAVERISEYRSVHIRRSIVQRGEAAFVEGDGHHALHGRASGVQVADGGAGEGVGPGVRGTHADGDVDDGADIGGVHAAQLGYGGSRPGRAPVPVRVDVGTRGGRSAQPRGYFVPDDQGGQEVGAGRAVALGDPEQAGQDVDGGMSTSEAVALVHFERDAGGGVDERGAHRVGAVGRGDDGGSGGRHVPGSPRSEAQIFRFQHTGGYRAERIQRNVAGGGYGAWGQAVERGVCGETG